MKTQLGVYLPIVLASCLAVQPTKVRGQIAGSFIVPQWRAEVGTQFGYWDLFRNGANRKNYLFNNPPALNGGLDEKGHQSTLSSEVSFIQNGSEAAFVTSSGAIYDFGAATAFVVSYAAPASLNGEITQVVFQTQTGGVTFDLSRMALVYDPDGSGPAVEVSIIPQFKAIDRPQSGGFSERLVSAFEWDLTGKDIRSFVIRFTAPGPSMPLWESQLDVAVARSFDLALGYVVIPENLPAVRSGSLGSVAPRLSAGQEWRFHRPGESIVLEASATDGWQHVGWRFQDTLNEDLALTFVMSSGDQLVEAIYAPNSYHAWREKVFFDANPFSGDPQNDVTDTAVSDPAIDHDGDGATNFEEYALGGDPYVADDAAREAEIAMDENGRPFLVLRPWAGDSAFSELAYGLESSTDLIDWELVPESWSEIEAASSRSLQANGRVQLRWPLPEAQGAHRYYRLTARLAQ